MVIVGGGLVGLSTAYHIASECHSSSRDCRVVVLDAAAKFWDTSSAYNTGSVNGDFPDGDRYQLAKYSFNMYRALSQDIEFRQRTNIKGHTCYNVTLDGDKHTRQAPGWVNAGSNWNLNAHPEDGSSMMMSAMILLWPHKSLLTLGVVTNLDSATGC